MRIKKRAADDLADWPAEVGKGHGPIPADAINPETLGIFDHLLWQHRGITGGPEALFGAIDSELSPETRAWRRHHRNPFTASHAVHESSTGTNTRDVRDGSPTASVPVDPRPLAGFCLDCVEGSGIRVDGTDCTSCGATGNRRGSS